MGKGWISILREESPSYCEKRKVGRPHVFFATDKLPRKPEGSAGELPLPFAHSGNSHGTSLRPSSSQNRAAQKRHLLHPAGPGVMPVPPVFLPLAKSCLPVFIGRRERQRKHHRWFVPIYRLQKGCMYYEAGLVSAQPSSVWCGYGCKLVRGEQYMLPLPSLYTSEYTKAACVVSGTCFAQPRAGGGVQACPSKLHMLSLQTI